MTKHCIVRIANAVQCHYDCHELRILNFLRCCYFRNRFQPKSLQQNSSQLIVGPGSGLVRSGPDGECGEKFGRGLSLSLLMQCTAFNAWGGALRPRARYYTSMQVLALPARLPLLSRALGCTGWKLGELVRAADSIRSSGMPAAAVTDC